MNALIVLIPVTLVLVGFAVGLFFWAVRHDQFRNLDTPEILPLLDATNGRQCHDRHPHQGDEPHSPKETSP